jgi:hypothetical protein
MTVVTSDPSVILGVTHLLVNGQHTPLLKCPFCNFLHNIHVDVIEQHIRIDHPGKSYQVADFYHKGVRASSPYGMYLLKADLNTPWIRCLFCNYRDKIEFDLSLHMLESHKHKLLRIPISAKFRTETHLFKKPYARHFSKFAGSMEFRLDVAVEMAREENRSAGVKHAVRLVQNRHLKNQALRKKEAAV